MRIVRYNQSIQWWQVAARIFSLKKSKINAYVGRSNLRTSLCASSGYSYLGIGFIECMDRHGPSTLYCTYYQRRIKEQNQIWLLSLKFSLSIIS